MRADGIKDNKAFKFDSLMGGCYIGFQGNRSAGKRTIIWIGDNSTKQCRFTTLDAVYDIDRKKLWHQVSATQLLVRKWGQVNKNKSCDPRSKL